MNDQNILIIGNQGQLATALKQIGRIADHRLICLGRPAMDFTQPNTIGKIIEDVKPALVINAAAYSAVDQAQNDKEAAFAVNASGVGELGRQCARHDIPVIHVSTDYVFDGTSTSPYKPRDKVAPKGVYGQSKARGETELRETIDQHLIFRTAWLFGNHGNNFLKTMLRLGKTNDQIRVVDDQHGAPTYAHDLAVGLAQIASQVITSRENIPWGTYHLTNSGQTTWCGFAREIFNCCADAGTKVPEIIAITTADYPTPTPRPAYSVLDCGDTTELFGVSLPDWKDATARCIHKIKDKN